MATRNDRDTSALKLSEILLPGMDGGRLFNAGFFAGDLARNVGTTSRTLRDLGLSDQDMRSGAYRDRIHPDDLPTYRALWQRVNEGWEDELYAEYRILDSAGAYHWIETHAVVTERAGDGSIGKVFGYDRDITSRKQAEAFLRNQHEEIREKYELAESLRQVGTELSADLELTNSLSVATQRLGEMLGFDLCQIYTGESRGCACLFSEPGDQACLEVDADALCGLLHESFYPLIRDDMGAAAPFRSWMGIPLRMKGEFLGAIFLWHRGAGGFAGADLYPVTAVADILSVAIHNNRRFRQTVSQLEEDELTGFLTRRSFERDAEDTWQGLLDRYPHNALVMIDIDHFKQVNDRYGHPTGDAVIRHIAGTIRDNLRGDDLVCRYGGEEFLALLPNTSREIALRVMERVRTACAGAQVEAVSEAITVSIGVAVAEAGVHQRMQPVIDRADAALYRAKEAGRNRVEIAE